MHTAVRRAPLATLPALDQAIRLNAEVVAVGRHPNPLGGAAPPGRGPRHKLWVTADDTDCQRKRFLTRIA
jgi:hypothetical protein